MKSVLAIASALLLGGCSLFFPEDPREGEEAVDECVERLTGEIAFDEGEDSAAPGAMWVPIYTYDITKLDLEALQDLTVEGSDETAGTRDRRVSANTRTAVDAFMKRPVDEKGVFFMGRDPALYRVRGAPKPAGEIVSAGCERQQANMRLLEIEAAAMQTGSPDEDGSDESETSE